MRANTRESVTVARAREERRRAQAHEALLRDVDMRSLARVGKRENRRVILDDDNEGFNLVVCDTARELENPLRTARVSLCSFSLS